MNLYYCKECDQEKFGPQWKVNWAGAVILVNTTADWPQCCGRDMSPTQGRDMSPTQGVYEEEIEEAE